MGGVLSAPVELIHVERHGSTNYRCAVAQMQGWRSGHEDSHLMSCSGIGGSFWVLDGHGGESAARLGSDLLGEAFDSGLDTVRIADDDVIGSGLANLDSMIRAKFKANPEKESGSTLTGALVARQDDGTYSLKLVNCGDSRTLVVRGPAEEEDTAAPAKLRVPDYLEKLQSDPAAVEKGFAAKVCKWPLVQETIDHKPNHPNEKARIEAAGGHVTADDPARVDGNLAVSRSLGDFDYKDEKTPIGETKVSIVPDLYDVQGLQAGSIIVLCCDGVWDVLSSEGVAEMVRNKLAEDSDADLGGIAAAIVRQSFEQNSRDNVTAMVVQLSSGEAWEKEKPLDEMQHFDQFAIVPGAEGALEDECRQHYISFLKRCDFPLVPAPCERCFKWYQSMQVCPCKTVNYCSRLCQKKEFSKHKLVCSALKPNSANSSPAGSKSNSRKK